MSSAFWPLQQAVYQRLTSDAALMARVKGVFDSVPSGQSMPYITIGDATGSPYRAFGVYGEECTLTLHIWSDYKGFKETGEILAELDRLLADTSFEVTGWGTASSFYDFSETLREGDDTLELRHVPVRYRIILQKQGG